MKVRNSRNKCFTLYEVRSKSKSNVNIHYVKYRNFTWFPSVEILRKGTISAYFQANRPKLYGNCAFPQNFHTKKLDEITVFYAVIVCIFWIITVLLAFTEIATFHFVYPGDTYFISSTFTTLARKWRTFRICATIYNFWTKKTLHRWIHKNKGLDLSHTFFCLSEKP